MFDLFALTDVFAGVLVLACYGFAYVCPWRPANRTR